MVYKIEIAYPDFYEVKRCVRNKEDFLNEIVEIIRLYCDNIKTVEPDSDQAKMLIRHKLKALTNERERSILAYPTELSLLYAVSDISPKYFYINQYDVLKDTIQNCLVNGYNINNVEILKDFNGWSWDKTEEEQYNYIDNIIYQNLLVILGEKFLYEWRIYASTRRDFQKEAKKHIKEYTSNDLYLKNLYRVLYLRTTGKEREKIDEKLKVIKQKFKKMNNKEKFLEDCQIQKNKLNKKIDRIDRALNDPELLEKEYIKASSKLVDNHKKIKSLKKYTDLIVKEREKYSNEVNELSYLLVPSNFNKEKKYLEDTLQTYLFKGSLEETFIELQKQFLYFLDRKLTKVKTRDEVIDVIYQLRYYSRLKIGKKQNITDIDEIEENFDKVLKKAVTILCKNGALRIVSMDITLNYEIIKYALDTKIINLEETKIALDVDKEGIIIKVFDKDVFEKQGRKKTEISKKMLEVKKNRKIKIFN